MLKQEDLIALVDACLDDRMKLIDIVTEVRVHGQIHGIIESMDNVVYALKKSKHERALTTLIHIKSNISRYSNLNITMG